MSYRIWSGLTGRDEDEVYGQLHDWTKLSDETRRDFVQGKPIASVWPEMVYEIKSEYPPVDTFKSSTRLIVSRRIAQVISEYVPVTDVEFLPITTNFKGQPYGEYFILHPLVIIDAVDRIQSKYTIRKGKLRDITKLSLDESKLSDKPFVRLYTSTWLICVSDELAHAIEQSGMHGVVFPTPEQWRPY